MKNIINQLKKNELFKGIDNKELEELISQIKYLIKKYSKNEMIAHEDDVCSSLSLVIDGDIEIQRLYSNGKYIVLKRLGEGDVFGEALVFSKAKTYPATVMSLNKSTVFFISKEDVLKLCSNNEKILENFMSLLSDKVFILNSKIKSISFKSIRQRVINFILDESKEQRSNIIALNNTKEEIAASLGIPRPSLSRELIYLRDNEFIDFDRRYISIIDIEGLEEVLFN